jgi:hypothetical protein
MYAFPHGLSKIIVSSRVQLSICRLDHGRLCSACYIEYRFGATRSKREYVEVSQWH